MTTDAKTILLNSNGGAIIIVLAIMLMLSLAAMVAVDTAQTDIELSFNQLHSDQAFYIAEAGLQQAVLKLTENNTWDTGYAAVTFEQGFYSVAVTHSDVDSLIIDSVTLRSTGVVEEAHANLMALVVPRLWHPFQFAMFGDTSLIMANNTCTDSYNSDSGSYAATVVADEGDIASNGTIDLINSAVVGGDASTADTGGISICATCTVTGDTTSGVEPYTLEPIPDSEFVWAHDYNSAPGGLSGSYTYDGLTHDLSLATMESVELSGGAYFFNDITFSANSQLSVAPGESARIYMTGDLTLQNSTSINAAGLASDLLIFSTGTIYTMGMSIDIHAAFYSPDADVVIGNGCDFYGSIVAASVMIDNAACVHYDRALSDFAVGTTGEMIMVAWKEL